MNTSTRSADVKISQWGVHLRFWYFEFLQRCRLKYFPLTLMQKFPNGLLTLVHYTLPVLLWSPVLTPYLGTWYPTLLDHPYILLSLLMVVWAVTWAPLIFTLRTLIDMEQKARRDREAVQVWQAIASGKTPEFVLYLRRFFSDVGIGVISHPLNAIRHVFIGKWRETEQIDERLATALTKRCPILKIGRLRVGDFGCGAIPCAAGNRKDDVVGGGDEDWWSVFRDLAPKAKWIVATPFMVRSSGLMAELSHILTEGLRERLLLVMPQAGISVTDVEGKNVRSTGTARRYWSTLADDMSHHVGLALPKHKRRGGLLLWRINRFHVLTVIGGRSWLSKRAIRQVVVDGVLYAGRCRDALRYASDVALFVSVTFWAGALYLVFMFMGPNATLSGETPSDLIHGVAAILPLLIFFILMARYFAVWWKKLIGVITCALTTLIPLMICIGLTVSLSQSEIDAVLLMVIQLIIGAPLAFVLSFASAYFLMERRLSIEDWRQGEAPSLRVKEHPS